MYQQNKSNTIKNILLQSQSKDPLLTLESLFQNQEALLISIKSQDPFTVNFFT